MNETAGQRMFDRITYFGINYGANVLLSIGAIWAADRTRWGKSLIDNTAKSIADFTHGDVEKIRTQVRFSTLLTGGFSVLIPVKWMEDHKGQFVRWYDKSYYKDVPNAKEMLAPAYAQMDTEHRHNWSSILASRFMAMVPFYTFTGLAMKENQWLARQTNGAIFGEKLITQAARGIDSLAHQFAPATSREKALAELAEKNHLYPNGTVNNLATGVLERPLTALADYAITETITSYIVAAFMYRFKQITGPLLGTPHMSAAATPENAVDAQQLRHEGTTKPAPAMQVA